MDKHAFFEDWFTRVWVNEDMTAIEQMTEPEVVARGLTDAPHISRDGFRGFAKALLAQCKFTNVSLRHFMEDGDWAHMLLKFDGIGRVKGSPISFDAQVLARIQNERMVEAYNHANYIALFQQLGTLPPDTISTCLCGQALR